MKKNYPSIKVEKFLRVKKEKYNYQSRKAQQQKNRKYFLSSKDAENKHKFSVKAAHRIKIRLMAMWV
jgi:hypothetical protein